MDGFAIEMNDGIHERTSGTHDAGPGKDSYPSTLLRSICFKVCLFEAVKGSKSQLEKSGTPQLYWMQVPCGQLAFLQRTPLATSADRLMVRRNV
ncbi:unnamed protein product [Protopolystoma xenopodis]|uniref:Uncharacterized protein n=1 Tax=Protopolystoma xenopodis TaxID=117903 RepID=A0A448XQD6_9PLAT|nr:unnamed protein product [Protopolystoma xenopodis]